AQGQLLNRGSRLRIVSRERDAVLKEPGRRGSEDGLLRIGLLRGPVAPGIVRFGHVAAAHGYRHTCPGPWVGLPPQTAPLADEPGVENLGYHRTAGRVAILQDVELSRIARANHDRAVAAPVQTVNLAVVQPGDLAAFLRGLVHLEKLALHSGADEEPAV